MEIFPENLGTPLEAEFWRGRAARKKAYRDEMPFRLPDTRNTILAWLLGSALLTVVLWLFQSTGWGVFATVITLCLLGLYLNEAMVFNVTGSQIFPRSFTDKTRPTPLTKDDLEDLRRTLQDPLPRIYLDLSSSILADTLDTEAEREVRTALQALGTTVLSLPTDDPKTISDDPAALRSEAAKLEKESQAEPDAVIGASLHRRAESLTRRADTAARTLLLLRRNQALRQETGEQMDALRTSLTAFRVGGRQSAPELAELAASIQRVAQEANAITAARAEVDTLLIRPVVNASVPAVEAQQVRG